MQENSGRISLRTAALIASISLVAMTVIVMFPLGYAFPSVIVDDDAAATLQNLTEHSYLFRAGIFSLVIVIILDVVAAWALYVFLAPVQRELSLIAAWFRVVYSAIFAAALGNLLDALTLSDGGELLAALAPEDLQTRTMLSLQAFSNTWQVGFIFFGVHLALLGFVILRSEYVPRLLGVLLLLGGASYIIDYAGVILFPGYGPTVSLALGWTELIFVGWLLFRGGVVADKNS